MSIAKNIFCCSLLIISSTLLVVAQNDSYIFRHITASDGLASNIVSSIIQDSNGFMWFGTENGLQKYDGYSFVTYHHEPADPKSIDEDRVGHLLEDSYRNIWVKTHSFGFNLFNPFKGEANGINPPDKFLSQKLANAFDVFSDNKGDSWFTLADKTMIKYNQSNKKVFSYSPFLRKKDIILAGSICYDKKTGKLWIPTHDGIYSYDPENNILLGGNSNPDDIPVYKIQNPIDGLFIDRDNNMWISAQPFKIFRYNMTNRRLIEYHIKDIFQGSSNTQTKSYLFNCILQDRLGTIWMGASSVHNPGLLRYDSKSDSFLVITAHPSNPDGLQCSYQILSICEDREGNIWIGTDKGINIFSPNRQKFFSIKNDPDNPSSFPHAEVISFLQPNNGDIWVATWLGGVAVLDSQLRLKKRFFDESSIDPFSPKHSLTLAWSLLENTDGKIWIGCQHAHLAIFDTITGQFSYSQPPVLDKKTILKMIPDRNKNIWMALYSTIAKWDAREHKFTSYADFIPYNEQTNTLVHDMLIDSQNNIWVATENLGLQRFDPATEKFVEIYTPEKKNPYGISSSVVNSLAIINDSTLAIGTGGGGINLFNTHTKQFGHITTAQGLPTNDIGALYFQAPADLWITTRNGLCKVNLQHMQVVNYGLDDGVTNNDFSFFYHFYETRDKRLMVGTNNGFIYFYPSRIDERDPPPDVKITGFRIFDKPLLIDSFLDKKIPISLSHEENFINIQFASLSYLSPRQTIYYYKLEGVDRDWVKAGNQRFASYTGLSGGHYTFKVKSENRNGVTSQNITTLAIIIHPPFWNTWWFYCLCIVALGGIAYFLYWIKINELKVKQELRNKIARDLHDDIGSSLSGINIYSRVALQKIKTGQEESESLFSRISERSEEMMDALSDIVWSLNTKNDNIENIIAKMKEYALEMLEPQKIGYDWKVEDSVYNSKLNMASRKEFYLIFKEAINNVSKYSRAGMVNIRLATELKHLILTVSDNGKGFDSKHVIYGNGIINMTGRAKKIGSALKIVSEPGKGTFISLSVPIP